MSRCEACGLWRSSLSSGDRRFAASAALDAARREDGLRPLREACFAREIELLARLRPLRGLRVLDVGSGHGWFLEAAEGAGASAEGIEPDAALAEAARARGLRVRTGYFPGDVAPSERFDVIAFHDVLEHLVEVGAALAACREHLLPSGLLVVTAPDAEGTLFAIARLLARLGVRSPLERLWQVGYPSPHVSYFDRASLDKLAAQHGFRRVLGLSLPSLALRGLWARVHMDRRPSLVSALLVIGLAAAWVALLVLPSDQRLHVFESGPGA